MSGHASKGSVGTHEPMAAAARNDVDTLAEQHHISHAKARELLQRFGHDRAKLDAEAGKARKGGH